MLVDYLTNLLLSACSFILVLGVAILIHEAGHFVVARLAGVKVEKFSIGFGKKIFGFKSGDTEFIIAPIPMGGYVKMAGENPAEVTGKDYEFYSISPWRRIPIVVAGPAANVLGAFMIFFGLAYIFGASYNLNVIGEVIPGSVADEVGLQTNDVLVSADGRPIEKWEDFNRYRTNAEDQGRETMDLEVKRGGETLQFELPVSKEALDQFLVLAESDLVGPAFAIGIREGAKILRIDGKEPQTWTGFTEVVRGLWEETPAGPMARTVSVAWETAEGEINSASITPMLLEDESGSPMGMLGVRWADLGLLPKQPPIVASVIRGFPAKEAGIKSGAEIIAVDGELIDTASEVERRVLFSYKYDPQDPDGEAKPVPVEISWRNPGEEKIQTVRIFPKIETTPVPTDIGMRTANEVPIGRLGVAFAEPSRSLGLIGSLQEGLRETSNAWKDTIFIITGLISGQVHHKLVGGPVAIIQISARIGKEGLRRLLWFCAVLQVNLALLNLLPIPILDGGHLVVSLCEGVTRRAFSIRTRELIQYLGLAILLPLFAFIFINDFARIGLFKWIAGLFT